MKKLFVFSLCLISGIACAMDGDRLNNATVDEILEYGLVPTQLGQRNVQSASAGFESPGAGQAQPVPFSPDTLLAIRMSAVALDTRPAPKGVSKRTRRERPTDRPGRVIRTRSVCVRRLFQGPASANAGDGFRFSGYPVTP